MAGVATPEQASKGLVGSGRARISSSPDRIWHWIGGLWKKGGSIVRERLMKFAKPCNNRTRRKNTRWQVDTVRFTNLFDEATFDFTLLPDAIFIQQLLLNSVSDVSRQLTIIFVNCLYLIINYLINYISLCELYLNFSPGIILNFFYTWTQIRRSI